jgi:hypothetical protein
MEKSDQKEVEYMMGSPWIDTRLTEEEMDFLWDAISKENKEDWGRDLAGNISKSELIKDKDNWFFKSALKELIERMFYRDWDNYRKYHIEKEESLPKFEMDRFWVNYQKQHEFNPLHNHSGLFSFVVFVEIPTHWKEQHALPISANSNFPLASDFEFVWSEKDSERCISRNFPLSSEDEGRMLFFPAWLQHQVYPFYGTEEERVTISGNIDFYNPNRPKMQKMSGDEYEGREKMLKMLEDSIKVTKEELKWMKKEREKEGLN